MLGEFQMTFEGIPLLLGMKSTAKPVQLLQLLIEAGSGGLSRSSVIEALFPNDGEADAMNSLNVAVSRLRKLLRTSDMPDENYVTVKVDRYYFACPFPVWVDTQEVTRLRQGADLVDGQDKRDLLYRLCNLYLGRFLPDLDGEAWAEVNRAGYQRIFNVSMQELVDSLEAMHSYSEILRLTSYASRVFPYDEWQIPQMESLLALGRTQDAHSLYREVEQLYANELGAPLPKELKSLLESGLDSIRDAKEPDQIVEELDLEPKGRLEYMSLPAFISSVRTAFRICSTLRKGSSDPNDCACVLFWVHDANDMEFTAPSTKGNGKGSTDPANGIGRGKLGRVFGPRGSEEAMHAMFKAPRSSEELSYSMDVLEASITRAFRIEGSYTRYSRNQFLVFAQDIEERTLKEMCANAKQAYDSQGCPQEMLVEYLQLPIAF